jgi:hypothetical protein
MTFSRLPDRGLIPEPVREIHGDPFGGIYIVNRSAILHFAPPDDLKTTLISDDLLPGIELTDLAVDSDRTLWIATNNGIYAWRDGQVRSHLDAATGLRNNGVKKLYLDSSRRLWFLTPENVGYSRLQQQQAPTVSTIPVTTFELPPTTTPEPLLKPMSQVTPEISITTTPDKPASPPNPVTGFLDALMGFFSGLFHR